MIEIQLVAVAHLGTHVNWPEEWMAVVITLTVIIYLIARWCLDIVWVVPVWQNQPLLLLPCRLLWYFPHGAAIVENFWSCWWPVSTWVDRVSFFCKRLDMPCFLDGCLNCGPREVNFSNGTVWLLQTVPNKGILNQGLSRLLKIRWIHLPNLVRVFTQHEQRHGTVRFTSAAFVIAVLEKYSIEPVTEVTALNGTIFAV